MRIFPPSMLKGLSTTYKNTPDEVNGLFLAAVEAGDTNAVNKIISIPGFDINKPKDVYGHTALTTAAFGGSNKIVQALISKVIDPKTQCTEALHHAIQGHGNVNLIQLLLNHGADINGGKYGFTPLMSAAVQAKKDIIEFLLTEGANPNLKDDKGRTALDHVKDGRAGRNTAQELTDLLSKAMKN